MADSMFISKRRYLQDSSFIDYNLFGIGDTDVFCSINFKVDNKIWYVYSGSKWQTFYANGKLHNVEELLSFMCEESDGSIAYHNSKYYFSPKHGIVVIASGHYYRREDYAVKGLDSLMSNM